MTRVATSILAVLAVAWAGHALAWGATGHRIIGRLAMESLPADCPPFLRTAATAETVGELAREPDRWKDSGRVHDSDRDPAHFLDLDDDGKVLGGPALADLPPTRAAYDQGVRAAGGDSWKAGYLPYAIIDAWQQLAKDFAYLRADEAAATRGPASPAHRAWFVADARARRALILRDVGVLAHYVGDGSQPMHVSEHFNGWGDFPNPDGFTQARVHGPIEGAFVRANLTEALVKARLPPPSRDGPPIEPRIARYLAASNAEIRPLYALEKAGGFHDADRHGRAFLAERLAAGAAELRDEITAAWRASARAQVGWPSVSVADVTAGRLDPYDSLYGLD